MLSGEAGVGITPMRPSALPANTPTCGEAQGHQHTLTRVDKVQNNF